MGMGYHVQEDSEMSPLSPIAPRPSPIALLCPDCGQSSTLEAIADRVPIRGFLECPACRVGSPAREWRHPETPWRALYHRARALDDLSPAARTLEERALTTTATTLDAA